MRNNLSSDASRVTEVGMVWEEIFTNTVGSEEIPKYDTVRVRSTGNCTVLIDGILAATMAANEILLFCVGRGSTSDNKETVTFTVAGDPVYAQWGINQERI